VIRTINCSLLIVVLVLAAVFGARISTIETDTDATDLASPQQRFDGMRDVAPLPDFANYQDVQQKKRAFFAYIVPIVQQVNQEVEQQRQRLISAPESAPIQDLCSLYKADCSGELSIDIEVLLQHIDTLPPSMVVAQAANESAWGTSRFARQGNNLFGEWCFTKGCGLVPSQRSKHQRHEVRRFESPLQSVRSYVHNINASHAYTQLRLERKNLKQSGSPVTGIELADGLANYSIRGDAYVEEIQAMIRQNNLTELDAG